MRRDGVRRSRHVLAVMLLAGLAAPAAAHATFPGTPGQILYTCGSSGDEGAALRLCVVAPDGSGNRRLVAGASNPAWSPDGAHYAYIKSGPGELPGSNPEDRIHLSNLNGASAVRRLENDDGAGQPAFAPDGVRLAFAGNGRGTDDGDIWVTDLDNRRRNLTAGVVAGDAEPDWSPDGRRIAFSSNREDGRAEIYTVDVESGSITRITRSPAGGSSSSPSWSPDGSRIAFVREQTASEEPEGSARDLWVVGADGSGERPVTDRFGAGQRNTNVHEPAWSPDGTRIAFSYDDGNVSDSLRIIGTDGSGETALGVTGYQPDWGPAPGSGSVQPLPAPRLSGLKLSPRTVWSADSTSRRSLKREGVSVRVRMSAAGYFQVGYQHVIRGKPRGKPFALFTIKSRAGTSRFRWTGLLPNGFSVGRGTYRLVLIPFNPLGDLGPTANSRPFRVLGSCLERQRKPCR